MTRERQHGPVVELSRVAARRARRGGTGLAGPAGMRSVFGQMVARLPVLTQEALGLPQRVWKVKFVGEYLYLYDDWYFCVRIFEGVWGVLTNPKI